MQALCDAGNSPKECVLVLQPGNHAVTCGIICQPMTLIGLGKPIIKLRRKMFGADNTLECGICKGMVLLENLDIVSTGESSLMCTSGACAAFNCRCEDGNRITC